MSTTKIIQIEPNSSSRSKKIAASEPDFSHRLSPLSLTDTIDHAALKAHSVLALLIRQFTDEDAGRSNDETIYYAIQSAMHDIDDIRAVVSVLHEAARNQRT